MVISLVLFVIAVKDQREHRIPNYLLCVLIAVAALEGLPAFDRMYLLLTSSSVLLFTFLSGCGYGDSKLAIILLNLIVSRAQILDFLLALVVASAIVTALHIIRYRSLRGDIAFAPALCGAFLALTPYGNY